jgi:type I restriction enzyme R subunit
MTAYEGRCGKATSGSTALCPRGIYSGLGTPQPDEKELLSVIVQTLNDACGTAFTPEDKVDLPQIHQRITEDEELLSALMADNTLADMRSKFDQVLAAMLLEFVQTKLDLFKKVSEPSVNQELKRRWFDGMYRQVQQTNRPGFLLWPIII